MDGVQWIVHLKKASNLPLWLKVRAHQGEERAGFNLGGWDILQQQQKMWESVVDDFTLFNDFDNTVLGV